MLFDFRLETGHSPRPANREEDIQKLKAIKEKTLVSRLTNVHTIISIYGHDDLSWSVTRKGGWAQGQTRLSIASSLAFMTSLFCHIVTVLRVWCWLRRLPRPSLVTCLWNNFSESARISYISQARLSVPTEKISDEFLSLLFSELSPVCAIVGGVLSQEVIKVNHYFRTVLRENFKKTETAFISEFQGRKKSFWYLGKDIWRG